MSAIPLRRIEGKYEILEKIREGGMGAIYKVRHRLLDEIRVIKLMRQQLVEDPELKARFLREARLAIKLRHPNIAQLYDFTIDDDGTAFIVMEFIDGLTLEDVLSFHGPPPLGFALEIAQQSLRALGYLHARGFVHRDISPDNLMLTEDTEGQPLIKLIDLGIAKTLDASGESHLTQTGTFLGKLRYAPPEQFGADGATAVDARADLYSFGVVLYELLTARFPINGRDPSSLIAGHLFRPPLDFAESDSAGRVPDGLRAAVLRALAKKPGERFANAQEMSRALAGFRAPSDVAGEDLKRLLTRPFVPAGTSVSRLDPGSTQGRLDEHFDLGSTPSPVSLLVLTSPSPSPAEITAVYPAEPPPAAEEEKDRELAAALAGIETALERRDFRGAEILLYAAEANFGQREVFPSLYERIAEQQHQAVAGKVKGHLESARRLAAARDFAGARAEALKARRLDAESSEAAALLAEIEAGQKRAAEVATLVATARELAGQEDFKSALKELRRAGKLDPVAGEVGLLKTEIETASQRKATEKRREQQRTRDAKKIEGLLAKDDLDAAGELLNKAVAAHGEEVFEALRERLDGLRWEKRRAEGLAAAIAGIHDALDRGELNAAGELLDRSVARFGAAGPLREQWELLEQMRRAAKAEAQAAAVADHLAAARRLAGAKQLAAALEEVDQAAGLAPADPAVLAVKKEIGAALRRQKEEKRRAAELALAVTAIELRLDHAELAKAAELLEKAKAEFGDQDPLPKLRSRLEGLKTRRGKPPVPPD
ncbi:MAG TPA: protein kinase [Thermoanaerobaculia bacterium]|nr:protein kinase [Thermoanaerobaculia bacterium]